MSKDVNGTENESPRAFCLRALKEFQPFGKVIPNFVTGRVEIKTMCFSAQASKCLIIFVPLALFMIYMEYLMYVYKPEFFDFVMSTIGLIAFLLVFPLIDILGLPLIGISGMQKVLIINQQEQTFYLNHQTLHFEDIESVILGYRSGKTYWGVVKGYMLYLKPRGLIIKNPIKEEQEKQIEQFSIPLFDKISLRINEDQMKRLGYQFAAACSTLLWRSISFSEEIIKFLDDSRADGVFDFEFPDS